MGIDQQPAPTRAYPLLRIFLGTFAGFGAIGSARALHEQYGEPEVQGMGQVLEFGTSLFLGELYSALFAISMVLLFLSIAAPKWAIRLLDRLARRK